MDWYWLPRYVFVPNLVTSRWKQSSQNTEGTHQGAIIVGTPYIQLVNRNSVKLKYLKIILNANFEINFCIINTKKKLKSYFLYRLHLELSHMYLKLNINNVVFIVTNFIPTEHKR